TSARVAVRAETPELTGAPSWQAARGLSRIHGPLCVSSPASAGFSPTWTCDALLPVFVGGVGTLAGPIVGTIFYILVREQLAVTVVGGYHIIFGALFILVVLAMPGGIVGSGNGVSPASAAHGCTGG